MTQSTLQGTASYLDAGKATLRNTRPTVETLKIAHEPKHKLLDLQEIQSRLPFEGEENYIPKETAKLSKREIRSLINRLHNILRDHDGHSNIIERFDELTKLLFLKLRAEEYESSLFHRHQNESDSDFANRLRAAYCAIAKDSSAIPNNFKRLKMKDVAICECAAALGQISFQAIDFDVKGLAYEEVIKNTFDKSHNQQFFTPPPIVKFMVQMLRPQLHGAICDPAAGTGGFLVEVLKSNIPYNSLTAFEIDERLAWVAGINLAAHGAKHFETKWLPHHGTLGRNAKTYFNNYDAILTNPPFGSNIADATLLQSFELGATKTSRRRGILFLERCHQLLRNGGVMAFVIDESILNGNSTEDVRRFLTEKFQVDAIISLPETAFMPYASVNASILFLRKSSSSPPNKHLTFFAKARKTGRKNNGDDDLLYKLDGRVQLNSDLPSILQLYQRYINGENVVASDLAYTTNIVNNLAKESDDWRLDFRFHHPARKKIRQLLKNSRRNLIPIVELCSERNDTIIPSKELEGQVILYTGLANIETEVGIAYQVPTAANFLKSSVKKFEPGDILFAKMRPSLRKVAFMDGPKGGYASPECLVLTVKTDMDGGYLIDPLLLSVLLRSDLVHGQIMHLVAGIGRPRLSAKDLRRVRIPVPPKKLQQVWKAEYCAEIKTISHLRDKARSLLEYAVDRERKAIQNLVREFV